jgi:hypothetical protein
MRNISDTVNIKVCNKLRNKLGNKLRNKLGNEVSNKVEDVLMCDDVGFRNIRLQVGIVLYNQVKQNVKL